MNDLDWNAINTGVVILSGAITGATIYLRMFMNNKMSAMKDSIMTMIESKFSNKEIVELRISEHERRLQRIETKMENIRVAKEHEDHR